MSYIYAVLDDRNIVIRIDEWEEPSSNPNYVQSASPKL